MKKQELDPRNYLREGIVCSSPALGQGKPGGIWGQLKNRRPNLRLLTCGLKESSLLGNTVFSMKLSTTVAVAK